MIEQIGRFPPVSAAKRIAFRRLAAMWRDAGGSATPRSAPSSVAAAQKPQPERPPQELSGEELHAKIEQLLNELPVEIRDPVSRGGDKVVWSSIPDYPATFDVLRLSDNDFAKYSRLVDLQEQAAALPAAADVTNRS